MRKRTGRKLLVASLGVAAVSYVACGTSVANLLAPPRDGGVDAPSDATADSAAGDRPADGTPAADTRTDQFSAFDLVANLVAPMR